MSSPTGRLEFSWWDGLIALAAIVPVFATKLIGPAAVNFAVIGYVVLALGLRIWWGCRKRLTAFVLRPFAT